MGRGMHGSGLVRLCFVCLLFIALASNAYTEKFKAEGSFDGDTYKPDIKLPEPPDISSGFGYDFRYYRLRTFLSWEIRQRNRWKLDFSLAEDYPSLSIGYAWTDIFEITTALTAGYDMARHGYSVCLTLLIIKF